MLLVLDCLLHYVTALGKSTRCGKVLTVSWVIFLHVSAPVRIDDHHLIVVLLSLVLLLLLLLLLLLVLLLGLLLIVEVGWVSTWHRLARPWLTITLRHHYSIDAIELDLVLLIKSVEVEAAYLTIWAHNRIRRLRLLRELLAGKRLMRTRCLCLMLSTYFSCWESRGLWHSLHANIGVWVTRARFRFLNFRLKNYLRVNRLRRCTLDASLSRGLWMLSFLLWWFDRTVNVRPSCYCDLWLLLASSGLPFRSNGVWALLILLSLVMMVYGGCKNRMGLYELEWLRFKRLVVLTEFLRFLVSIEYFAQILRHQYESSIIWFIHFLVPDAR